MCVCVFEVFIAKFVFRFEAFNRRHQQYLFEY